MTVKSGGKTTTIENHLYAGGLYQITVHTQNITARELNDVYKELLEIGLRRKYDTRQNKKLYHMYTKRNDNDT